MTVAIPRTRSLVLVLLGLGVAESPARAQCEAVLELADEHQPWALPRGEVIRFRTRAPLGSRVFLLGSRRVERTWRVLATAGPGNEPDLNGWANHPIDLAVPATAPIGTKLSLRAMIVAPGASSAIASEVESVVLAAAFGFDFESGLDGWVAGFADYPVGEEAFYELANSHSSLPAPLDPSQHAFEIQGNNHSDDLFMYLKRRLTGLRPNTNYRIGFRVRFASMYPTDSVGIGGSPGSGVALKVGAASYEPDEIVVPIGPVSYYRMNIDHGNQGAGGDDMVAVGHVGIPGSAFAWTLIGRTNRFAAFDATTAADGSLWLIVASDSGYEGTTQLYYDQIGVVLY